jgi:hypothetical protein
MGCGGVSERTPVDERTTADAAAPGLEGYADIEGSAQGVQARHWLVGFVEEARQKLALACPESA